MINEKFILLYDCLVVNHNLHRVVKEDDKYWLGWCEQLSGQVELVDKVCQLIDDGELDKILSDKKAYYPTLQDVKKLFKKAKGGGYYNPNAHYGDHSPEYSPSKNRDEKILEFKERFIAATRVKR